MANVIERTTCPQCSSTRSKGRNIKCLVVFDNGNSFCHHCSYSFVKTGNHNEPLRTLNRPAQELPQELPEHVVNWFADRKISKEVLERNKISWNEKEILFPYFYNNEILNIKYRTLDKAFRQTKNAEKLFYGLDDIRDEKFIYICEGEIDKLSCEVAGFTAVLSVPDGAPSADAKSFKTKFEFIDKWGFALANAERIIIAVDNDAPGKRLEQELIRRFDPERCWIVKWPEGYKDANDVLVNCGILGLMTCLENPEQIPIEGVFTVEDYADKIKSLYLNGLQPGSSTGWPKFDELYTVKQGQFTVVGGMPSSGKSSFLTALLMNLAVNEEWKFGIFSPENQPLERYMSIMAALKQDKPFREGVHERMSMEEMELTMQWLNKYFFFILPDDDCLGIEDILSKAKSSVMRYGINGLVIDPWNEVDSKRPVGMTETEHISICLRLIRQFALTYMVHVWIVAHPTKLIKNERGVYPMPTPYDISGSSAWYNRPDCIFSVWRNLLDETSQVEVGVQKIRFGEIGTVGSRYFKYNKMTGSYCCEEKKQKGARVGGDYQGN